MIEDAVVSIRLDAQVEKSSVVRAGRSRRVYTAALGAVEASAGTKAEAGKALAEAVKVTLEGFGAPVVLWSLDGREAWLATSGVDGQWGYSILEASRAGCDPRFGGTRVFWTCGPLGSREECLERMRAHWWDGNGAAIVEGIFALFTDVRRFVCRSCRSVSVSGAPYVCRNPACGKPWTGP